MFMQITSTAGGRQDPVSACVCIRRTSLSRASHRPGAGSELFRQEFSVDSFLKKNTVPFCAANRRQDVRKELWFFMRGASGHAERKSSASPPLHQRSIGRSDGINTPINLINVKTLSPA